jgi:hypothetical protein
MYANAEAAVVGYLAPTPGVAGVSVELPLQLLTQLPFVLVTRVSGADNYITDSATVDLDVFNTTRALAAVTARIIHGRMMRLRHTSVNGVLVDNVETITGPSWLNYQDENVQRYVMSYIVESRVNASAS